MINIPEIDFKNFNEEIEGLKDIEDILEVLSGPFGQYVFEIKDVLIIHIDFLHK